MNPHPPYRQLRRSALRFLDSPARAMLLAVVLALVGYIGLQMSSAETQEPQTAATEEILVKYKQPSDEAAVVQRAETLGADEVDEVQGTTVKVLEVPAEDKQAVLKQLDADPRVEYAEPNFQAKRLVTTPNDEFYSEQWAWPNVKANALWDRTKGSANVIVAAIDDGISTSHPEFAGKLVAGYDAANNDNDPTHSDYWHGTMVAATMAAVTNNATGVAGACWNCKIMPVNVFLGEGASISDIVEGTRWAVDHGAHIINLSLGTPSNSQTLADAMTYAVGKGVIVVAAAGNDGASTMSYPAAFDNVIAVGATDETDQLAEFSQFGTWVDVAAPGTVIGPTGPGNDVYEMWEGTSFSSPIVAGIIGLLKSAFPNATPAQVRAAVTSTADTCCGAKISGGRINAEKAYAQLAGGANPAPVPVPNPVPNPNPNPTPGAADLNADGKVNIADLSTMLSNWGKGGVPADLNKSGKVDISDLSVLLSAWTR